MINKKIKLIKNKHGIYESCFRKIDNVSLDIIYVFLTTDYINQKTLVEWLKNEKQDWIGTNICFIEKSGDKLVLAYNSDSEKEYAFVTKKEYFVSMIEQWNEKVINKRRWPSEVVITLHNDGKVTIDPKD